jgi:hypothetical protein
MPLSVLALADERMCGQVGPVIFAAVVGVRHPPEVPGTLQAVEGSQPAADDKSKGKKISLLAISNV